MYSRFNKFQVIVILSTLIFVDLALAALTPEQTQALIKLVDENQRSTGDYTSTAFIEQKEKGKPTKSLESKVYRRDIDDKWMIIFTKPKTEAQKGYLRIEKNLFFYEPALGKWERQTERASIAGTGSRRNDFDESRLSEEYVSEYIGEEKLGKFIVHHVKLTAKPGVDVASPIISLWLDKETSNIMKRQEFALSKKLLRTLYYPQWKKMFSPSKKSDVWVPEQIRIFDEIEKENSTLIVISEVKLDPLPANLFTKAWIESQSK